VLEAGDEDVDAGLELVVGGDAGQQGGQLDGVGELAGGRAAKKPWRRRTNSSLVWGLVPARGSSRATNPRM
jgi:hypothetical protein